MATSLGQSAARLGANRQLSHQGTARSRGTPLAQDRGWPKSGRARYRASLVEKTIPKRCFGTSGKLTDSASSTFNGQCAFRGHP
jgi:hypothetical protein